jgi:hypothetical protein
MIKHSCGREIFLRRVINITTGLSITPHGIIPTGKMTLNGETKSYELYCDKCGTLKSAKEIDLRCFECGKEFKADDLFTIGNAGGIYCKEHADENYPGMRKYNIGGMIDRAIKNKNEGAE